MPGSVSISPRCLNSRNVGIIVTAGAGLDEAEAAAPAIIELPDRQRVLVFAFGTGSAGVPRDWAAGKNRAGVNFLPELSSQTADEVAQVVDTIGDLAPFLGQLAW